jgi:uncharacterized protein (TIGR03086 family)
MSTQPLQQAITSTRAVLAGVKRDQLDSPTPCQSWTVAQLVDHVVGGQYFFTAVAKGEQVSGEPRKFADGDFVTAFDEGSASALAAFSEEGAMERTMHLPFGDMPGAAFVGLAATDTFTHGWDLARATGQSTDLNPGLAEGLLAGAQRAIQPSFRGADGKSPFGPEQQAPAGASNADRLAAFLGRTV